MSEADLKYWRYFLSIEEDFIKTLRYVDLSNDNYQTYSIEYTRLLISTCAEIETMLKLLCKSTGSNCDKYNISKLKKKLYEHEFCLMHEAEVNLSNYEIDEIIPFASWEKDDSKGKPVAPEWWRAYNNIKHDRDDKFKEANLENVIYAIAGLFIVEMYYYIKLKNVEPMPKPKLFGLEYYYESKKIGKYELGGIILRELPWKNVNETKVKS